MERLLTPIRPPTIIIYNNGLPHSARRDSKPMPLNAPYIIAKLLEGASLGYSFHLIPDLFLLERESKRISTPHSPDPLQPQPNLAQIDPSATSNNNGMSSTVDIQKYLAYSRFCRYGCHAQIVLQTTALMLRYWSHDALTTLDKVSAVCYWSGYAIVLYALWKNERKMRGMLENEGIKDVETGRLAWEDGEGVRGEKVGLLEENEDEGAKQKEWRDEKDKVEVEAEGEKM
jgi:hypothetical protein